MSDVIKKYYIQVIVPDLINKFDYGDLTKIPKIKKIILNFGNSSLDLKNLTAALLALELISNKQGKLTLSSKTNLMLKVRKGVPVGCKIVLVEDLAYQFIFKLIYEVFPNVKRISVLKISKRLNYSNFSFSLKDLTGFNELSKQFYFFSKLPPLNITFIINSSTKLELIYLLKSFKFPIV